MTLRPTDRPIVKGRFEYSDSSLAELEPGDCVSVGMSVGDDDGSGEALVLIMVVEWVEPALISTEEAGLSDFTSSILATDQPSY